MILFKISKGHYSPILMCDWCGQRILHPAHANVLSVGPTKSSLVAGWLVHKTPCDKLMSNSGVLDGHAAFVYAEDIADFLATTRKHLVFDTKMDSAVPEMIAKTLQKLAKETEQ